MSRFLRRAALRGAAVAVPSALVGRRRDVGAAAAAGALAAGAAIEHPAAGAVAGIAAAVTVARSPRPLRAALAAGAGASAALGTTRIWPVAPRTPADARRANTRVAAQPTTDGGGLTIVVNPSSGPALARNPADALRDELPGANVIELEEGMDLVEELERAAAAGASALGAAGGDGTLSAAAAVALRHQLPFLAVPAGTLNHFARDLGVTGVEDAAAALRQGHAVAVDVATIDGHPFLNTASFGTYSELVDRREALESRIGKWPALVVALVRVLRRGEPIEVEVDGRSRLLWMVFIGNCRYHPNGFAPAWRERLDDGRLDVRLVDAGVPAARLRLLLAVLTGRLGRSTVYETSAPRTVEIVSRQGPMRLAADGETFDGSARFTIEKSPTSLPVYAPPAD
jgi:undecaprenyl-diphosphatase